MKVFIIVLTLLLPDGSMMQKVLPTPSIELNTQEMCDSAVQKTVDTLAIKMKPARVFGGCFEVDGNDIEKLLPPKV